MIKDAPSTDQTWSHLMVLAQAGDTGSYRQFLQDVAPYIRQLARRYAWTADDLEDVVQDVLLTVHRIRHTYDPARPIKPWLVAIAHRRSIDAVRRRSRISGNESHNIAAYETFADDGANKPIDADDAARQLPPLLAELKPRQREALEMVKLRELSLAEASAQTGQSIASLKVNIHRGMKALQKLVVKHDKTD